LTTQCQQSTGRDLQRRVELVQVPAQPARRLSPLNDQVSTGVDEQLDLSRRTIQLRHRQVGLTQRGERDSLGVDRVRLARAAHGTSSIGHQPRVHAHDLLASAQQVTFEAPGQVPAVLDSEANCFAAHRPLRGPLHRRQVAVGRRGHGLLAEATTDVVEGHHRVRLLVRVHPDRDRHGCPVLLTVAVADGLAGEEAGTPQSSESRLLSGHAASPPRSPTGAAHRGHATSTSRGSEETSEPRRAWSSWH
jgi:hypothetical protein